MCIKVDVYLRTHISKKKIYIFCYTYTEIICGHLENFGGDMILYNVKISLKC